MLALALTGLLAAGPVTPPAPTRWVTDEAGLLSPATRDGLDRRLQAAERRTGHQVLVWIGTTSGGEPIEVFAERAFQAWKVGRAGLDDGVVLFVFARDRTLRLEVGYGLEPVLPDAICARIINERITPRLAAGDADGALTAGVDALLAVVGGDGGAQAPVTPARRAPTPLEWGLMGAAALGFLVLLIIRPDLALRLLAVLFFLRRGGRPGGGGFSGRGGRSGGGGATGRW